MEPIRVLQVVTLMDRAGLETMIMNYYRNIDRSKVQFDFLVHREGEHDYDEEIRSLGGRIYAVPPVNPLNTNGYITSLDRFFAKHKEHKIVHAHLDCLSTYPLKFAKRHGIPVRIAHSHSTGLEKDFKYLIKKYSRLQIPKYATHLFACSEAAGRWLYGKSKFSILNNAIDAKKYIYNEEISKKIKKELGIENKFVVGHIGRFHTPKNHTFLIDIFNEIYKRDQNSVLVLAGTGELQEGIKAKVKGLGLEHAVKFLGLRDDVNNILQAMDVFLFPSLFEGFGIALIEAQATGLHCLTSKNSVPMKAKVTDLVEYITLESSAKVWADKIISFKGGYERKNTYNMISAAHFDIKDNSKSLEKFYIEQHNKLTLREKV